MQQRRDRAGWLATIEKMRGIIPSGAMQTEEAVQAILRRTRDANHKLADFFASVRGPDSPDLPFKVSGALERAREMDGQCFPVLDGEALAGMVTTEILEKAWGDGDPERRLDSLPLWNDPAVHVHPDSPLEDALDLLSQTPGALPVTNRSDTRRLMGVITLDSILKGLHASRHF